MNNYFQYIILQLFRDFILTTCQKLIHLLLISSGSSFYYSLFQCWRKLRGPLQIKCTHLSWWRGAVGTTCNLSGRSPKYFLCNQSEVVFYIPITLLGELGFDSKSAWHLKVCKQSSLLIWSVNWIFALQFIMCVRPWEDSLPD